MTWTNNKMYDTMKWVCLLVLPAAATLVLALTNTWGLPYGAEIAATITAIDAFLGAATGISSSAYAKKAADGTIYVDEGSGDAYAQFKESPADKSGTTLKMDVKSLND